MKIRKNGWQIAKEINNIFIIHGTTFKSGVRYFSVMTNANVTVTMTLTVYGIKRCEHQFVIFPENPSQIFQFGNKKQDTPPPFPHFVLRNETIQL